MAVDRTYFEDIFEDLVDTIRPIGTITSSTEVSSGNYTVLSTNTLREDEKISIDSIDYKISSVDENGFSFEAGTGLDFTGLSWKALAPYAMYGHAREISTRLDLKTKDSIEKWEKFPLIWLITDLKESSGDNYNYLYSIDKPRFFIVNDTDKDYTSPERLTNNFKPILQPIYENFLQAILDYRIINTPTNEIENEKYNRYSWGSESAYGNDKLIFNDWLDAIEFIPNGINVFKSSTNC